MCNNTLSSFQIHHEKEHARHTHEGRARRFGLEAPLYRLRQKGHGGDRDRTDDPLLAKQVLSQLSYAPWSSRQCSVVSSQNKT